MKQYLELGQIVSTHGVRGEMRFNPWCDSADFATKFNTLYFDAEGKQSVAVQSARVHGNIVLLKLEGIDTMEKAQSLRQKVLYIDRESADLPENTWFVEDLLGCRVVEDGTDTVYGSITDVQKYPANDVWTVKEPSGKDVLVPAIKDVVVSADIENKTVYIKALKGLFSGEESVREDED
ncbi:MAG: ribosome maturation factor RimM [Clostridiaceae bacterium]|nr:ribosome maturation factor RimM [Clostridiaceae bacterium]